MRRAQAVVAVLLALTLAGTAQTTQPQSAPDASGAHMTNGVTKAWTAGGQAAIGSHRSADSRWISRSGFLAGVLLASGLDHDGDGTCDELDDDNDNDAIGDEDEITGRAFLPPTQTDPNRADSDGDGLGDGDELGADTSPTNAVSVLAITRVTPEGGGVKVEWTGGTQARQYLARSEGLTAPGGGWQIVFTNTPPTATTVAVIDTGATNPAAFYQIRAERP